MPTRKRYIQQSTIFDIIGQPKGYEELSRQAQHYLRHDARIRFDVVMGETQNRKLAASEALLQANDQALYFRKQQAWSESRARCGAKTKGSGKPCRMKPIKGRKRCKYHGGLSTGPKTLSGRIRALSGLKQYSARPDLLSTRIGELEAADHMAQ